MSPLAERRKHKRVPVKIAARIFLKSQPGTPVDAELLDLSLGGAFVHCTTPIKIGEEITLDIRFAETQLLDAKVVIANQETAASKEFTLSEKVVVKWARGSSSAGFGVEFVALNQERRDFIAKLLQYFESLKRSGVYLPNR